MSSKFLDHFAPLFGEYRYKICLSGRLSAKTTHIILALLWIASRFKVKIACLREIMDSIKYSSKAEIEYHIENSGTRDHWIITDTYIQHIKTGSIFTFHGMHANVESLKGLAKYDIAWIEECETISKKSWDKLQLSIRNPGSQIWVSGNPRDRTDTIAQVFIENEPPPNSVIIRNSYLDNPYISESSLADIEHLKKNDSERYRHELLGEYLDQSKLVMVKNIVRGEAPRKASDRCVVGVDIARSGGDRTVICVRRGRNIEHLKSYPIMELDYLAHILQQIYHEYKPERINIDSTGSGLWAGPGLSAYGVRVEEINYASCASDTSKYANKRTEMYALARQYFENGGTIPTNATGLELELQASYYTLDNKHRLKLVPKDEIKNKIGRSPDEADAFCTSLICDGDMFYDNSNDSKSDNNLICRSIIEAGMF